MPKKLKIILGVLVLVAGFLIVRLGLYFNKSVKVATSANMNAQVLSAEEENPFAIDSDSDGIPDVLEAYYRTDPFNSDSDGDGYIDGEEIVAGTDSTKKDELLASGLKNTNITDLMINRLVAGIYSGDLNPRSGDSKKYEESMDYLTFATIDDAIEALTPRLTEKEIAISDDSKQSQEKYLQGVATLLEGSFLDSFTQQPQMLNKVVGLWSRNDYEGASKIFSDLSLEFTTAYTELLALSVPPSWLNFHNHLLATFQKISTNYLVLSKTGEDPVLAMVALNDFSNNMLDINVSLMQELKLLIQKEGLQIPKTPLFDVLDILNYKP